MDANRCRLEYKFWAALVMAGFWLSSCAINPARQGASAPTSAPEKPSMAAPEQSNTVEPMVVPVMGTAIPAGDSLPTVSATQASGPQMLSSINPIPGVSLRVPFGWQADGEDSFSGPDGFWKLENLGNFNDWNALARLCELEANLHPERYGRRPILSRGEAGGLETCFIRGAAEQNFQSESAAALRFEADGGSRFLLLRADTLHIEELANSLKIGTSEIVKTLAPVPAAIETPGGPIPTPVMVTQQLGGLQLDEYALVSSLVDTPSHIEFNNRIPSEVFTRRETLGAGATAQLVAAQNGLLKPFGYELKMDPETIGGVNTFRLIKNGVQLVEGITEIYPASLSRSGKDFVMGMRQMQEGELLLRKEGIASFNVSLHAYTRPVFVGDDLVEVMMDPQNPERITVQRGGQVIFEFAILPMAVKNPVEGLWSWNGQWLLGVDGILIVDGKIYNDQAGVDEIFNWQLLGGKPFYFFSRAGKTGLSWGGETLAVEYDEVVHGMCCEPGAFNPGGNSDQVWFHARRGEMWYYVEVMKAP